MRPPVRALALIVMLLSPAAAGAQQASREQAQPTPPAVDHSAHQAPQQPAAALPPFVPPLTDADRAVVFHEEQGHGMKDNVVNYFVLFDQLEGLAGGHRQGASWDSRGWVGTDRDRFWFRTEGTVADEQVEDAQLHALYGRAISRWWDLVAGVRQDFRPGPSQAWAAIGVQGLAPYWFEVEATAYVGASGRTHFRFETEYELLLTNRLVLQPLVELEIYGKDDLERGIGAGFSSGELGLRLRYEIRREFAPYGGVVWHRKFFGTADHAAAHGEPIAETRAVFGVRVWM